MSDGIVALLRTWQKNHISSVPTDAADLIERQQLMIRVLEKDAARYRWLRESWLDAERKQISSVLIRGEELAFDELDAAIDAAMKEGK